MGNNSYDQILLVRSAKSDAFYRQIASGKPPPPNQKVCVEITSWVTIVFEEAIDSQAERSEGRTKRGELYHASHVIKTA